MTSGEIEERYLATNRRVRFQLLMEELAGRGIDPSMVNTKHKKSTHTRSGYRNIPAEDADECDSESKEYTSYVGGAGNTTAADDTSDAYDSYLRDELEMAGIDADEFEWMDEFEKKEVLEDAGLDPWDYDIC